MSVEQSEIAAVEIVERDGDWQLSPVALKGGLTIKLFGLRLGRIDLDLTIASLDAFRKFIPVESSNRRRDLSGLTHRELYQLARDASISGRSSMSRDQLIAALST